jgi:hypothetical protein
MPNKSTTTAAATTTTRVKPIGHPHTVLILTFGLPYGMI